MMAAIIKKKEKIEIKAIINTTNIHKTLEFFRTFKILLLCACCIYASIDRPCFPLVCCHCCRRPKCS